MGLLSREKIKDQFEKGRIVIDPFDEANLNSASYDVRLGPHFFREQTKPGESSFFNPFDENDVTHYWGESEFAVNAGDWMLTNRHLENISAADDLLIVIGPGETILAHTIEFIGGRSIGNSAVTSEMRARSSVGRVGITVCKCAGWGDVGFINRWTMEITNLMKDSSIILPVGMRIAQIVFFQVAFVPTEDTYAVKGGKYQTGDDLSELQEKWRPTNMLPRLYNDLDVGNFHRYIPENLLSLAKP